MPGNVNQKPALAARNKLRFALVEIADWYATLLRSEKKHPWVSQSVKSGSILTIVIILADGIRRLRRGQKKKYEERRHRTLAELSTDDSLYEVTVPFKGENTKVIIKQTSPEAIDAHKRLFLRPSASHLAESQIKINKEFYLQMEALWTVMVPSVRSKESGLLFLQVFFLCMRTWLSLVVARLDGTIVRNLVGGKGRKFVRGIVYWLLIAIPASYTNAMIKFLQAKISIALRTRLTRYIHDIYVDKHMAYYKIPNLDGGATSVDQYVTNDVTRFCDSVSALFSSLGKPTVDLVVFNYQLAKALGPIAFGTILTGYIASAWGLKRLSPPFGKLAAVEARLEGDFRTCHSVVISNAEEIAFYDGAELERSIIDDSFRKLIRHLNQIYKIKIGYHMTEDIILKYTWSALGYLVTSLPVFLPEWGGANGILELKSTLRETGSRISDATVEYEHNREQSRTKDFITSKRLMLSLADAGARIMYSLKDLSTLAGYTSRVYELMATLHRVHANAYATKDPKPYSLGDVQGTVQEGYEGVRLEGVPIVAPAGKYYNGGELLINPLNVLVRAGDHMLISGANGVGKSAVARIIAKLWPVYRGLLSRPASQEMYFLPQRPYLSLGSLRDQVIYPDCYEDMIRKGINEDDLLKILETVRLGYLPSREGGWDVMKEWQNVFSGGEKQRVGFARLLYHRPRFAIIDEPTSAVSSDVEGILYESCSKNEITLITISHRPGLRRYHVYLLKLGTGSDGRGSELEQIGTAKARMSIEAEIKDLESQLSKVPDRTKRRKEIDEKLSLGLRSGTSLDEKSSQ